MLFPRGPVLPATGNVTAFGKASLVTFADTDLIISGAVIAAKDNSIDLKTSRSLRGNGAPEDIRVWLKVGDYCSPETDLCPVGTQWVMAPNTITDAILGESHPSTPNISYGRIGDYSLSNCRGHWLRQNNAVTTGNPVNAPRWERKP